MSNNDKDPLLVTILFHPLSFILGIALVIYVNWGVSWGWGDYTITAILGFLLLGSFGGQEDETEQSAGNPGQGRSAASGQQADDEDAYDEAAEEACYEEKSQWMESILGQEADMVMHAIIPYAIGGTLDLYYYPNGIAGTGIASKELVHAGGGAASNKAFDCFEWVMFTKCAFDLDAAQDDSTPFGKAHNNISRILNMICRYSEQATLNPKETCEFPQDMEHVGGKCLIFDSYADAAQAGPHNMGLMLIIEIHRDEMDFARKNSGSALIKKLKAAGHYPYSDPDRASVISG